jgi:hypothetical protein
MCPLCISTTAIVIAGATSTGGLVTFLAHRFVKKGKRNAEKNRVSR